MEKTRIFGVYREKNQLYTIIMRKQNIKKIYDERIVKHNNKIYRSWNPYKSKLAAAILNGLEIELKRDFDVLYLGAATGTTVSHISDICRDGMVFAVESSPVSMKKLVELGEYRNNVIPVLADANHPDRYNVVVPQVDFVYQDVSQRNQVEIFVSNISSYLKKNGFGLLMVKARSIDVSIEPREIYGVVCSQLEKKDLRILNVVELKPYEKDHVAVLVSG